MKSLPGPYLRLVLLLFLILLLPESAGAIQQHPAEEGHFVHQIGHYFFAFSMGVLVFWLRQRDLIKVAGWRHIQYSAIFFLLWNVSAIAVHALDETEGIFERVALGGWNHWIRPVDGNEVLTLFYYFGRMDHFLCVPGIIFLYIGLKDLLKQTGLPDGEEGHS